MNIRNSAKNFPQNGKKTSKISIPRVLYPLALLGAFGLPELSVATDYFVCFDSSQCNAGSGSGWSSGSASNDGLSKSTPWQCPNDVQGNLSSGDVVLFGDSNYSFSRCGSGNELLNILGMKGTAANWITLRSENKYGAVFDGQETATDEQNRSRYLVKISGASYFRFEDFEMKRARALIWGNDLKKIAHHIYLKGMKLHDCGIACVQSKGNHYDYTLDSNIIYDIIDRAAHPCVHTHAAYMMGYNHTLVNNVMYSGGGGSLLTVGGVCSMNGQDDPATFTHTMHVINNTFDGNGCVLTTTSRVSIDFYNRMHANQDNCSIPVAGTPRHYKNVRFENNLFLNGETTAHPTGGAQFIGNTVVNTETAVCDHWPWLNSGCQTAAKGDAGYLDVKNNVSTVRALNSDHDSYTVTVYQNNCDGCVGVNLINEAGNDYRLTENSTALIGKGSAANAPSHDILGNPRNPGSIDVGAYQFSTSGPRPMPPTLTVNSSSQ